MALATTIRMMFEPVCDYSFYVKTIETHARAFLTLNILAIGRVATFTNQSWLGCWKKFHQNVSFLQLQGGYRQYRQPQPLKNRKVKTSLWLGSDR